MSIIFKAVFSFTGVMVNTPEGKKRTRAAILVCSADLPAKALIANCNQYNGYFGCNTCDGSGAAVGRTLFCHLKIQPPFTHDSIV